MATTSLITHICVDSAQLKHDSGIAHDSGSARLDTTLLTKARLEGVENTRKNTI